MIKEEAWNFLDNILSQVPGTRDNHEKILAALEVLHPKYDKKPTPPKTPKNPKKDTAKEKESK